MTQPIRKLNTLVMVIQNRIPIFRSFTSIYLLLLCRYRVITI